MKCILLNAGFGKRLYPLTENKAKSLIDIEDNKPIINYMIEKINRVEEIDEIHIITNNKFYKDFTDWKENLNNPKEITIHNNRANNSDERLGAMADIMYTVNMANIDDDILIIAGDNLFDYSLRDMVKYFKCKNCPVVASQEINDGEVLKRTGIVCLDADQMITLFKEKPKKPKSNIVAFATYIIPKDKLGYINQYLSEGNRLHSPGYFIEYIYRFMPVYSYMFDGTCYSVATFDALEEIKNLVINEKKTF